jgi:putative addiction module component (TIGR02574 family)
MKVDFPVPLGPKRKKLSAGGVKNRVIVSIMRLKMDFFDSIMIATFFKSRVIKLMNLFSLCMASAQDDGQRTTNPLLQLIGADHDRKEFDFLRGLAYPAIPFWKNILVRFIESIPISGEALKMDTKLQELPVEERIRIVEDLWDSIAAEQKSVRLTSEQRTELDRRMDTYEADGNRGRLAEDVVADIRRKL